MPAPTVEVVVAVRAHARLFLAQHVVVGLVAFFQVVLLNRWRVLYEGGFELKRGMTFTVEPMVNAGKRHVRLLPDGWTVITKDHSLSAQWEHTVLVTESGFEILTPWPDGYGDYAPIIPVSAAA